MRLMQVAIVLAVVFAAIRWQWFDGPGAGLAAFFVGGWLAYAATCFVTEVQTRSAARRLRRFGAGQGVNQQD